MQKILILGLILAAVLQTHAQSPIAIPNAEIDSVRLYLEGAEVFRSEEIVLKPGRNHFYFTGISSKLYPRSIQMTAASEQVEVLSITSKTNFLDRRQEDARIVALKDSVRIQRESIEGLQDEREAYQEEKEFLQANQSFKGHEHTLTVAELRETADFYRKRMKEINVAMTQLNREESRLYRRMFDMKLMLQELNEGQTPTAEVHIVLKSERTLETNLALRYVVADAGWTAVYDLESGKLSGPVNLRYRARAYNNTGVDWDEVAMTLTTLDPLESATQPTLSVWNLDQLSAGQIQQIGNLSYNNLALGEGNQNYYMQIQQTLAQEDARRTTDYKKIMADDYNEQIDFDTKLYREYRDRQLNEKKLQQKEIVLPDFNIDFPIEEVVTLPSDLKPYSIEIGEYELPASYQYYAVPKKDKDAFLVAQITGWEDLDLISGPVNIYNGRRFIGESQLDIRTLSDTLMVSLGRDKDVVVTRVKVAGKNRRVLLGATKKMTVAYNISVANHKQQDIEIEVLDQLPITMDKEVMVIADELGGAEHLEKVGTVKWRLSVPAGKAATREFGFTVKYPKNKYGYDLSPNRGTRTKYMNTL